MIRAGDTIKVSRSFGIVGSAVISGSKAPVIVVAANNNEPVTPQQMNINKPLVKMINALASIDGLIKQRLENQKTIAANQRLAQRESQIEQQKTPQIEVIQPDAERVSGSNAGLFAVGGLLLLTLDPVQEAIKDLFDGVVSMGRFVTGVVSSINDAFKFLLGDSAPASDASAEAPAASPREGGVTATPAPPSQQGSPPTPTPATPAEQATPAERPSFFGEVGSAAMTGAAIGSFIPRVGTAVGAVVGGAYGALNYAFSGGETSSGDSGMGSTAGSTGASSPDAVGGAVTPVSPGAAGAADAAETQVGMRGSQVGGYLSQGGVALNPTQDQWCSAFVNSSLARAGVQGATNVANSFQRWGVQIDPSQVQRGDVVLQTRGKGPDQVGGHVGIATGKIVDGKVEMIAGNSGSGSGPASRTVKKYFVPINQNLQVRRNDPNAPGITAAPVTTSELNSTNSALSNMAGASLEVIGKVLGAIGGAVVAPGIPRTDIGGVVSAAASEYGAEMAANRTETPPSPPSPPAPPRINVTSNGAVQNPATTADRNSVYYYLRRFGFQDLSTPESALRPAA